MSILYAVLVIGILAFILGWVLEFVSKKFAVKKNERLVRLEEVMPGANCGGCGYAGCASYAEAVEKGEAEIGKCSPGGANLAAIMSEIMGVEAPKDTRRMVAFVKCRGDESITTNTSSYSGISDCNAASLLFGGNKGCKYGCLHLGSCIKACSFGAIKKDEKGNIIVDKNKCASCGKCIETCPHKVISLIPYDADFAVACNNPENGASVNKVCKTGCIGCRICVNKYPESGCVVNGFLSSFNYDLDCKDAESAATACPKKIIVRHD